MPKRTLSIKGEVKSVIERLFETIGKSFSHKEYYMITDKALDRFEIKWDVLMAAWLNLT